MKRSLTLALALAFVVVGQASAAAVDLGEAGDFALLGLTGTKLCMSNPKTTITGDVGLGPLGIQNFSDGKILGTYYVDPTADDSKNNNVVISVGPVSKDLQPAVDDALAAYDDCVDTVAHPDTAVVPAVPAGTNINGNVTLTGGAGDNVISLNNINLAGGAKFTLNSPAGSNWTIRVAGSIKISNGQSAIQVAGGLSEADVLFCIAKDVSVSGGADLDGTYLLPFGKLALAHGDVTGAMIVGGTQACLPSGATITFVDDECNIQTGPFPACCSEFDLIQCIQAQSQECLQSCF